MMWELESKMKESYLKLLSSGNSRGRKFFKWGRVNIPIIINYLFIELFNLFI